MITDNKWKIISGRLILTAIVGVFYFSPYMTMGALPDYIIPGLFYALYFILGGFIICYTLLGEKCRLKPSILIASIICTLILSCLISGYKEIFWGIGICCVYFILPRVKFTDSIIIIVSLCLVLTVSDLILRPLLKSKIYYRPEERFINYWPPMPSLSRYDKNVFYEGEAFGDLAAISGINEYQEKRKVLFETDSLGFRNNKEALKKPLDVIVLGDSFGMGSGTSQEQTLSSLLSNKFGFSVYNLSIPASPWNELMNLKIEFKNLITDKHPVILWLIFTGNDLDEDYGDEMEPHFDYNFYHCWMVSLASFRNRSPIKQLLKNIISRKYRPDEYVEVRKFPDKKATLFYIPYLQAKERTVEDVLNHKNYKKMERVFDEMKNFCELNHLPIAVILIPDKSEVYPWLLNETTPWISSAAPSGFSSVLKKICQDRGLYYMDLKPFLIEEAKTVYDRSGSLLWWHDDSHWNTKGHDAVAAIIYKNILLPMKKEKQKSYK